MTAAAKSTAHSVVEAGPRAKAFAGVIVVLYAVIAILPLLWIAATAFKSQSDAIAYPPKVVFQPTLEGYVNLLSSGGPGSTTELVSITLKRTAFEKWRTGYSSALAIILFVTVFGAANIYVKVLNRVKQR